LERLGGLAIEQQGEPFGVAEAAALGLFCSSAEGAGHAGQAELDELIDGGWVSKIFSSVVVAGTADVGWSRGSSGAGRRAAAVGDQGPLWRIELNRAVGPGADLQPAAAGRLEALDAVLAGEAEDAQACAEALLGVRAAAQDHVDRVAVSGPMAAASRWMRSWVQPAWRR